MADPQILSLPSAMPGADSKPVIIQRGVRYLGRVDTDGPAVWEEIARSLGFDSMREATLSTNVMEMFATYLSTWLQQLPTTDPGIKGRAFLNGNFVNVDTAGSAPVPGDNVPVFWQGVFDTVINNYFAALPVGPLADAISLNGNFVNVDL